MAAWQRGRLVVAGGAALCAVALVAAPAPDSRHASVVEAAAIPTPVSDVSFQRMIASEQVAQDRRDAAEAAARAEAERVAAEAAHAQRHAEAAAAAQRADRAKRAAAKAKAAKVAEPRAVVSGDIWRALANCEASRGQDSANGLYHGFFQFRLDTWRSVGGTGDPHEHSYEVQRSFAQKLQARSGWGQWPRCTRRLGLR